MSIIYVYIAYFALNLYNTPPLHSLSTMTDSYAINNPGQIALKHAQSGTSRQSAMRDDKIDALVPPLRDVWPVSAF